MKGWTYNRKREKEREGGGSVIKTDRLAIRKKEIEESETWARAHIGSCIEREQSNKLDTIQIDLI